LTLCGCAREVPLSAETVIRDPGRYLSPTAAYVVEVQEDPEHAGQLQLKLWVNNPSMSPRVSTNFDQDRGWFMVWDAADTLWFYTGTDVFHWYHTDGAATLMQLGEGGVWTGIPDSFLHELPAREQAICRKWLSSQES
jgi:hypothetical protein